MVGPNISTTGHAGVFFAMGLFLAMNWDDLESVVMLIWTFDKSLNPFPRVTGLGEHTRFDEGISKDGFFVNRPAIPIAIRAKDPVVFYRRHGVSPTSA
jgi:hypothetical protein